jgi:hypothetical protein
LFDVCPLGRFVRELERGSEVACRAVPVFAPSQVVGAASKVHASQGAGVCDEPRAYGAGGSNLSRALYQGHRQGCAVGLVMQPHARAMEHLCQGVGTHGSLWASRVQLCQTAHRLTSFGCHWLGRAEESTTVLALFEGRNGLADRAFSDGESGS